MSLREARLQPPAPDVLDKQVLERLITERALLQFAKETGIRVDDTTVDRTIQRIAQENKLSPEEFRKVLEREGIPYPRYREDIRRELTIQRLRDREVENRIFISDPEVDNYMATVNAQAGGESEYLISHILVRVPEQSSPDQIDQRRARAEDALEARARRRGLRAGRGRPTPMRRTRRPARASAGGRPRGCRRCSSIPCAASRRARPPACCAAPPASTS